MKNFFSNTIKKAKDFIENLTPTAKLKYIVISVLTIAVVASILVVVVLNTSKPETPTPTEDFGSGEAGSLDFDTEIIYEIGGESSSVSTTGGATDGTSITTNETSGTDEPTSDEESSNVETDNNTETTDDVEPQPTDPSQDYNPDPQPEDTTDAPVVNPYPTETTTQTQTTLKPTETTTKQTQTQPKPIETTTKATQTDPKPTETTTKTPQTEPKPTETTKPQENSPQTTGQFSLKEKKYDYNGSNVSILQVENKSQQAYTITITGKFKDANGKVIKTESKTFEGFPAGWSNYFVFQPGVKYSSVTWGMETVEFVKKTYAEYVSSPNKVDINIGFCHSDGSGAMLLPTSPEEASRLKMYTCVYAYIGGMHNSHSNALNVNWDYVIFDNNGGIYKIDKINYLLYFDKSIDYNQQSTVTLLVTNVLWENKDNYEIPSELHGTTCISGLTTVSEN